MLDVLLPASSAVLGAVHGLVLLQVYGPTLAPRSRDERGELTPLLTTIVVVTLIAAALVYSILEHDGSLLRSVVSGFLAWVIGGTVTQTIAAKRAEPPKRKRTPK